MTVGVSGHEYKPIGFSGKKWPQYQAEVEGFIETLVTEGVRSYLEIGCRYGDTFHAVGMALPEGARMVACDLPDARNGRANVGRHPDSGKFLERAAKDLTRNRRPSTVILGNSHDPKVVAKVRALGPFDAVLIDGDHTPAGALADWEAYGPLGRIVAFHDVVVGPSSASSGPAPLFAKLAETHRHKLISIDPQRRGFGVIWRA